MNSLRCSEGQNYMVSGARLQTTIQNASAVEDLVGARRRLQAWIEANDFAGYEPYDILNSPYLSGRLPRRWPINILLIQIGKRFAGSKIRRSLSIPPSKNPKALGLLLSAYCALHGCDENARRVAEVLKNELIRLRSPDAAFFCWGYDWDFYSLRGPVMSAYSPNAIATYFCARGLLDMAEVFADAEALDMAESAARFFLYRLNRSVDSPDHLCFSYTPGNFSVIYNSSALVGAFLARMARISKNSGYTDLARRAMRFLVSSQRSDGSWFYGEKSRQRWIDHFHTGYNLCALREYMEFTGDRTFESALMQGYTFYKEHFFETAGAPKYFHNRLYPIDIHSCAQGILTFLAFASRDNSAVDLATNTARWVVANMQADDGSFYYQRHRFWTNRTPYMRWGQAWMFSALSRLESDIGLHHA